jgi:hypothetical protein
MTRPHAIRSLAFHLLAVGLLVLVARATAAQEDPFGDKPKPAAGAAGAKPVLPPDPIQRDPLAIELLRASNPTTPEQLISAAQSALQYGRADECKRYLAKLLADKPPDDALAPITARYGDFLFRLTRTEEVQPEGKQAAEMIFAAAQRTTQNPERIAAAIVQLSDPQLSKRQESLGKLYLAGTQVVNPMLHALADPSREKEHANIRAALVQLAGSAERPLISALDAPSEALKMQIIAVLARMGSSVAKVHLIRPALDPQASAEMRQLATAALQRISGTAPDLYEAEKYLTREANDLLQGDLPYPSDADDRVTLWSWDAAKQEVVPASMPRRDAGVLLAARVASDLYALKPGDSAAQRLMLLTNLEWAKVVAGLDQPLPTASGTVGATAMQAGPQVVNAVLADALRLVRVPAAIAAAEVLARCGDASVLHPHSSGASPLAEAMRFSDRRVRLAAALAAVKLDPGGSFAGAGRVAETLSWFLGTQGASVVLVGHPRGEEAQSLIGFMNAIGYDGEGVYLGRVLAERAFANPDYEFILIADAIDMPPVEELVQWLRRDFRTARMPIGVMARSERFAELRDALSGDPFTTVFPRIHSIEVAASEIQKLRTIAGRNLVSRDERLLQARSSLAALIALAKKPANLAPYELLRQEPAVVRALDNPALTADAAALLALLGTPRSQSALIDFASQSSRPLADRQAAAAAFAAAVKSRGLLLTQNQLAQQYQRYNASATLDKNASATLDEPAQKLLGSILDAIEAPAIARGELTKRESRP